jgi:MarR family transcriptional regulator, organic hydroperoxide resistance regulator
MALAPEPADDPLVVLLKQLIDVSSAINSDVRAVLADLELTDMMSGLLWTLDPDRPPLRMREIAQRLGCDPSNVTLVGDKLLRAGLATREPHPEDRRSRALVLTERGREIREQVLRRALEATLLPRLSRGEQQELGRLLTKLGGAT